MSIVLGGGHFNALLVLLVAQEHLLKVDDFVSLFEPPLPVWQFNRLCLGCFGQYGSEMALKELIRSL